MPLRLEDFFPSPTELTAASPPPPQPGATIRQQIETLAEVVKSFETMAGRFMEGGKGMVQAARAVDSATIEETIVELERWERDLAEGYRQVAANNQRSIRQAMRSRLPEARGRYAELLRRDTAAREGALRGLRETRWQLLAIIAEREPIEGAQVLRSLSDLAALFGDEEEAPH